MSRFTTIRPSLSMPEGRESVEDAASRCYAAARLSMRGQGYAPEDRVECAAQILLSVLESTPPDRRAVCDYCAIGASWTVRYYGTAVCSKHARMLPPDQRRPILDAADGTVLKVSFGTLSGRAANLRRSLDRTRVREADDAGVKAAQEGFIPKTAEDAPILSRSDARRAAVHALSALGLPRLGKAYPLAYAAVRAAALAELLDGATSREREGAAAEVIARELNLPSRAALRQSISRARKAVPSALRYGFIEHLDACHLLDAEGVALKATASRNATADLDGENWRTRPDTEGAVTVRHDRRTVRKHDRRPDWARDLDGTATGARLERAAELRRARRDAQNLADRESPAVEGGQSYVVR